MRAGGPGSAPGRSATGAIAATGASGSLPEQVHQPEPHRLSADFVTSRKGGDLLIVLNVERQLSGSRKSRGIKSSAAKAFASISSTSSALDDALDRRLTRKCLSTRTLMPS